MLPLLGEGSAHRVKQYWLSGRWLNNPRDGQRDFVVYTLCTWTLSVKCKCRFVWYVQASTRNYIWEIWLYELYVVTDNLNISQYISLLTRWARQSGVTLKKIGIGQRIYVVAIKTAWIKQRIRMRAAKPRRKLEDDWHLKERNCVVSIDTARAS